MDDPFDLANAPTRIPETIVTGSYTVWRKTVDYSGLTYDLKYILRPAKGGTAINVVGVEASTYWSFTVLSATSQAWPVGAYNYDLCLVRKADNESIIIESGTVNIFSATADRRSHAEIMLSKIESILQNRADNDVNSYSIAGRSITKMTITELQRWRDYYADEIAQNKKSGPNKQKVKVRFV